MTAHAHAAGSFSSVTVSSAARSKAKRDRWPWASESRHTFALNADRQQHGTNRSRMQNHAACLNKPDQEARAPFHTRHSPERSRITQCSAEFGFIQLSVEMMASTLQTLDKLRDIKCWTAEKYD